MRRRRGENSSTAVFATCWSSSIERDDDDDDGLAWGEVISYEPSPDLGDVPVAVPIPSSATPPCHRVPRPFRSRRAWISFFGLGDDVS